jgi:hypothetical protein
MFTLAISGLILTTIFGSRGRHQIAASGGAYRGRWLARIGTAAGAGMLVLLITGGILYVSVLTSVFSGG